MKILKSKKGITLVALIITIIVLLILAVVAVRAITGDGILGYAKRATKEHNLAQAMEKVQLALNEWKIKKYADRNPNFKSFLEEKFESVVENGDGTYTVTVDGQEIKVSEDEVLGSIIETGEAVGTSGNTIRIGDLVYVISDEENKTATVYGYRGDEVDYSTGNVMSYELQMTSEEISIAPKVEINGEVYSVADIGNNAFKNSDMLTKVHMPNSIININDVAFSDCTSLIDIRISNSATFIGMQAFEGCTSLKEVTIPSSLETFGGTGMSGGQFLGCTSLEKVTILDGVKSIGDQIFYDCTSLKEVILPKSLTSVGNMMVFENTPWLETQQNNALNGLVIVNNYLLIDGKKARGTVEIPETVTIITGEAFSSNDYIEAIKIPESVTKIDRYAFSDCGALKEIEIPNTVTNMNTEGGFEGCTSLTKAILPESVTTIDRACFSSCKALTEITIPNNVKEINDSAFARCESLKEIVIPEGVTSIGDRAFSSCILLENITISSTVTIIGASVFDNTLWLTEQRKVREDKLVIVNTILVDGKAAEGDITIPEGVVSIGKEAFASCTSISEIVIPENVLYVYTSAFHGWQASQVVKVYWSEDKRPAGWELSWRGMTGKPTIVYDYVETSN